MKKTIFAMYIAVSVVVLQSQKASELERKQEQLETERTEATREAAHHREEVSVTIV